MRMDARGVRGVHQRERTMATVIALLLLAALMGTVSKGGVALSEGSAFDGMAEASTQMPEEGPPCDIDPGDGQEQITAAIAACPDGTTVRFPPERTYYQTDEISVVGRSDLVIDGNGSTFISTAPNDTSASIYDARPNWQIVEGTGVSVRNMTIRGNLPQGPRGILPGNQYNAGIMIYGGDGIRVSDVSVFSVFGEFVVVNPSGFFHQLGALDGQVPTDVRVDRLYGEHAGRQCVGVTAARGFWLENSTLRDCFQNGVDLEPDVAGEPIHDAHILSNNISEYYFAAIVVPTAYADGDVRGIEIRGNTTGPSDTCYPPVLLGGVQANTVPLHDITVVDNTLETLNEGVRASYVASGTVTGNQITIRAPATLCGPPLALPVRLVQSPGLEVRFNADEGYGR